VYAAVGDWFAWLCTTIAFSAAVLAASVRRRRG